MGVTINLGNANNNSSSSFWGYGGTASKIGGALTGLASTASTALSTYGDVQNAKLYIDRARSFMLRPLDINDSYENLKRDYSSWTPLSYLTKKDLGYSDTKGWLNILSSTGAGASAGASFGGWGALGGALTGFGMGLAGLFAGKSKAEREARKANNAIREVNEWNPRMFTLRYNNVRDLENQGLLANAYSKRLMGYADGGLIQSLNSKVLSPFGNRFDDGGPIDDYLHSNGSDWSNGFTYIGAGGTHEENPLGGTQTSVDSEGNPNLLEEGEVQYESKNNGTWAYSARREIPKDDAKTLGLNWHKGMTFADGMIERQKTAGLMPYDPIELRGFDAFAMRLANIQEREKNKEARAKELLLYANLAANGRLLDTNNIFSFGGLILPNILEEAGQVPLKDWKLDENDPIYNWIMNTITPEEYVALIQELYPDTWENNDIPNSQDLAEIAFKKDKKGNYKGKIWNGILSFYNNKDLQSNIPSSTDSNSSGTTNTSTPKTNPTTQNRIDFINKMSDEEWEKYVEDKNLEISTGVKTKQEAIAKLQDPDPMKRGALEETVNKSILGTDSVSLPGLVVTENNKWNNLGKSTRKYDNNNKPIPYSWEKNNLVHKDVNKHLSEALFGSDELATEEAIEEWKEALREEALKRYIQENPDDPNLKNFKYKESDYNVPSNILQWVDKERQIAIDKYLLEHPEDKRLNNFVDPTLNYEASESAYSIPNGKVTWVYEPNNLTEELKKEYTERYKDNKYEDSRFMHGIYTDPQTGKEITMDEARELGIGNYDWRPASALDLLTDPVTKTVHYDTALGEEILDKYKYDFTSGNKLTKPEKPAEMPGPGLSYLRYWPVIDSLGQVISDLTGSSNTFDFEGTNMLRNKIPSLDVPAYLEMQDFISPMPFAQDYYLNLYLALLGADRRSVLGNVGGNRAAATQALLTLDLNALNKIGELGRAGQEYNRQDYLKVRDYNRQSKLFDAELASKYNQLRLDSAKSQWDNLFKTVTMDDAMMNQVSQNRATNRDNLAENMLGVGEDAHNLRMLQMLINSGYFGTTLELAWKNYKLDYDNWQAGRKNKNNQPNITIIRALGGLIKTKRRKKHLTY